LLTHIKLNIYIYIYILTDSKNKNQTVYKACIYIEINTRSLWEGFKPVRVHCILVEEEKLLTAYLQMHKVF
jgi:hypothetical protein